MASFVVEQGVRDSPFHGGTGAPLREQPRLFLLAWSLFRLGCRFLSGEVATLCLGV
jgi:hypothetical protein